VIQSGKRGVCGVRENRDGILYSLVYGKAIAVHVDPIEKKPLFHFYPGTRSLSMATVGCNMRCMNCQNSDISQMPRDRTVIQGEEVQPSKLVALARNQRCRTIAYTYTEPAVFLDYAIDTCLLAVEKGIRNIFVTNGFFTPEALDAVAPYLHGANVDLKSFRDETYKKVCGARLRPVLDTIQAMKKKGIWVEVTTLVIPGINDSEEELGDIASFIYECDPGIPWHVSRFYPSYRMLDRPPTPVESIHRAMELGREAGLRYVYAGNVLGDKSENTRCYHCGASLIIRRGFQVQNKRIQDGKCPECGAVQDGVWGV
jgi:pyruvate formate lyase activating enzyme